jgi:hypothetical protein
MFNFRIIMCADGTEMDNRLANMDGLQGKT